MHFKGSLITKKGRKDGWMVPVKSGSRLKALVAQKESRTEVA